ncbi:FRUITFULL 2 MADS-box transcription factor [Heracleum sosnowskyi]|uniref:FRUITFULL 2 MADS-box transcription factor n=1 Tax=Heracleum sosnowskyi TaxID=360622 RepID=A0AAD8MT98_9APIA|nr:FRUITFULL 2 MADS-box transcription factor [Heracleum sosnowskyi]
MGKLSEFSTDCCMERILERYDRYSTAERQLVATDTISQGSWTLEHAKLKARIEVLQRNQKHYMGEDLDTLSLKELQNLEGQLDSALKNLRSRKNQIMFESISQLQKRDKVLQEQNNQLSKKVKNKEKEVAQLSTPEQQNQESSSSVLPKPLQPFNITRCSEMQQGRGNVGDIEETSQQQNQTNTTMPAWMLS